MYYTGRVVPDSLVFILVGFLLFVNDLSKVKGALRSGFISLNPPNNFGIQDVAPTPDFYPNGLLGDPNQFSKHTPSKHYQNRKYKTKKQHHNILDTKKSNAGRNTADPRQQLVWNKGVQFAAFHGQEEEESQTIDIPPFNVSVDGIQRNKVQVVLDNASLEQYFDLDKMMGTPPGPHFDRTLPRNISVQMGKTAVLSCRVINRDNRKVSWIRHEDLHILTVDKYKYSTDERVSVIHNVANKEWVLRIKQANHSDAGQYECQLSTKPVLKYVVKLQVVVPQAHILNGPEIYVHRGSLINLTCVIDHGTDHPVFIYWIKNKEIVNIDDVRTNLLMSTEEQGKTISSLLIKKAVPEDSGKYTCEPNNGDSATVTLHILNEELQAAMQKTNNGGAKLTNLPLLYFLTGLLVFNYYFSRKIVILKHNY